MLFASKISAKSNFSGTGQTFTIENGEPIRVKGFILSNKNNTTTNTVSITMKNGTNNIGFFKILGQSAKNFQIPFLADAGLSFLTTTQVGSAANDLSITVFHSSSGA